MRIASLRIEMDDFGESGISSRLIVDSSFAEKAVPDFHEKIWLIRIQESRQVVYLQTVDEQETKRSTKKQNNTDNHYKRDTAADEYFSEGVVHS